nr:hypothetical protein [Nostoc sp. 'Peltigera malacea cyanobiont' DB3992]
MQASTKQLTGETPQFEVLELEKFNDEQIRLVLSHQTETATVEQVMGNPQLLDLARRPVMTELILEALPDIERVNLWICRGFTCTQCGGKWNGILKAIARLLLWQKSYTFCANFLGNVVYRPNEPQLSAFP